MASATVRCLVPVVSTSTCEVPPRISYVSTMWPLMSFLLKRYGVPADEAPQWRGGAEHFDDPGGDCDLVAHAINNTVYVGCFQYRLSERRVWVGIAVGLMAV